MSMESYFLVSLHWILYYCTEHVSGNKLLDSAVTHPNNSLIRVIHPTHFLG